MEYVLSSLKWSALVNTASPKACHGAMHSSTLGDQWTWQNQEIRCCVCCGQWFTQWNCNTLAVLTTNYTHNGTQLMTTQQIWQHHNKISKAKHNKGSTCSNKVTNEKSNKFIFLSLLRALHGWKWCTPSMKTVRGSSIKAQEISVSGW